MKKGITLVSLVLYIMLFFTFTVLATAISTNLNYRVLSEKGRVIINDNYMKLYTNLINSAKNSTSVDVIQKKLIFSNGDVYEYVEDSQKITKNKGNLLTNVVDYNMVNLVNVIGPHNDIQDFELNKTYAINITLKRYNESITRDIVFTLGDDLYE